MLRSRAHLLRRGCPVVRCRALVLRSGPLLQDALPPLPSPPQPLLQADLLRADLLRSGCPDLRCRALVLRSGPLLQEPLPPLPSPPQPLLPVELLCTGLRTELLWRLVPLRSTGRVIERSP